MKTRIQADHGLSIDERKRRPGIFKTLVDIARSKEGPIALYKGFNANILNTFVQQFAYFYWYTLVRSVYIVRILRAKTATPQLSTVSELVLGALAGALAQLFTTPIGVIATRQQIGDSSEGEDESVLGHMREIYNKDGLPGFWRGIKPSLVLTANPAITYGVYERIKNLILFASGSNMSPSKSFVIGALSKTLATIVTFPYILSKIRLQAKNTPYKSAFEVLSHIAREKGILGWYQGMQAQIFKAVLSQALLFYFRDYFEIWTRQLLKLSTSATA